MKVLRFFRRSYSQSCGVSWLPGTLSCLSPLIRSNNAGSPRLQNPSDHTGGESSRLVKLNADTPKPETGPTRLQNKGRLRSRWEHGVLHFLSVSTSAKSAI